MDVLFENKYNANEVDAREVYFKFYFSLWIIYLCFIVALVVAVCVAFGFLRMYYISYVVLYLGVILLYGLIGFKLFKKRLKEHKGVSVLTVTDTIIRSGGDSHYVEIMCTDIKKVYLTSNFIIIHSKSNTLFIFRRDSFTVGDEKSFVSFLNKKGFKVK